MKETVLQLKELLGSDFNLLVDAYDVDNREHLVKARECVKQQDADGLRKAIHSIKGASANIGAEQLASVCQVLESNAGSGNFADAEQHLDEIHSLFDKAVEVLRSV